MRLSFLAVLLSGAAVFAQTEDRERLIGEWQTEGGKDQGGWVLESDGDELRILRRTGGGQTAAKYECGTSGRECDAESDGDKAKISMWYNGNKLVQLETKGSAVTKRHFSAAGGDVLEVETIPIVPQGKPQVARFTRAKAAAASR